MQPRNIDCLTPAHIPDALPVTIEQHPSRTSAAFFVLLLGAAIAVTLVPLAMILSTAASDTQTRSDMMSAPWILLQASVGLTIWITLWAYPFWSYWRRLTQHRRIHIAETGKITVTDTKAVRQRRWTCHIQDFQGVCHHVRSSLSGTRHELSLHHANPTKSLVLHVASTITDMETVQMAQVLNSKTVSNARPSAHTHVRNNDCDISVASEPIAAKLAA